MPRSRAPIEDLRLAIDRLPLRTREAMLARGAVTPDLAAQLCGGHASMLAFARAWVAFTGSGRGSARELRVLETHLQDSIAAERAGSLGAAIAEHRALARDHSLA